MADYNERRKDYYDRRAAEYDDAYLGTGLYAGRPRLVSEEELRALERRISDLPPCRVLDIACGTGFLTRHLRGEVVGLDQSEAMLEIARGRIFDGEFVRGDALALPFPDQSFDRAFAGNFYGLLLPPERARFLSEARRVAPELVVVETAAGEGRGREGWEERLLTNGSRYEVYRRYFTAKNLVEELGGGEVLFDGGWFVMVRT